MLCVLLLVHRLEGPRFFQPTLKVGYLPFNSRLPLGNAAFPRSRSPLSPPFDGRLGASLAQPVPNIAHHCHSVSGFGRRVVARFLET